MVKCDKCGSENVQYANPTCDDVFVCKDCDNVFSIESGSNSVEECHVANVNVMGSSPIYRSKNAGVAKVAMHLTRNQENVSSSDTASPIFEQVSRCCK